MFSVKRSPHRLLAAATVAVAGTAAVVPVLSSASSVPAHRAITAAAATPKGGAIRVFVSQASQIRSKTTVTGAIGDYGTGISQDKNGTPDAQGNYEKIVLSQGTFVVNDSGLDKALHAHGKVQLNRSNCSFVFSGTGPGTISSGTGAYAGITGTLTITITAATIEPRKGASCNLSAPGKGKYEAVTGSGTVSFT
jgi:hypothetical protein